MLYNYMKKRKASADWEEVLEFAINQTNDNLIIKIDDEDTYPNENLTNQYKN